MPSSNLLLGLVPTPTWASVEGIWGYRSVEKTITDFEAEVTWGCCYAVHCRRA
ncbi:MAG: hypothetical protein ABSA44_01455 [Bacteroidota bacterium]